MKNTSLREKGITLIALIVTIIILMILAGVVVATITGNNGILNKAKFAKNKYQNSENEENNRVNSYENEIDKTLIDVVSSRNSDFFYGKNNKIFKIKKSILEDESEGYIPVLTSDTSSDLGIASSNFGNAYKAFDNTIKGRS